MLATRHGRWVVGGVALVVVLAVVVVVAVNRDDERSVPSSAASSTGAPSGGLTPSWFDPATAAAVYESGSHDVDEAAAKYLASRLDATAASGITLQPAVVTNNPGAFDTATVTLNREGGPNGVIHLRVDGGEREWEVTGAFVDGLELDGVSFAQGQTRVHGVNRSGLPARLVHRTLYRTPIDEQALTTDAFDVSTPTTATTLVSIELDREPNVPAAFAEVRVEVPNVEAIWPAQPTDEDPEELATRFATEELQSTAKVDATSVRDDAATITFRVFGPDGTEWSGVIVELKKLDGHWLVTEAYSRDITVTSTVDPATQQLSYTIDSPGSSLAWAAARPPGSGSSDALEGSSPVALENGSASGTIAVAAPLQVLIVLARSSELGDRYWLKRITA